MTVLGNKTLLPTVPKATDGSIAVRTTDFESVLYDLAERSLEKDANSGKSFFYAIVMKTLSEASVADRRIITDLFINEEYALQREQKTTAAELSNSKVAFVHIPALYTYVTAYTQDDSKVKNLTTSDLFLVPIVTNLAISKGDIVKVTFGDMENFEDPVIINDGELSKRKVVELGSTGGKKAQIKKLLAAKEACTQLQTTPPSGSSISPSTLANPSNPTVGYFQLYDKLTNSTITSDNLRRKVIRTLGSSNTRTELTNLELKDNNGVEFNSTTLETLFIGESEFLPFKVEVAVGSADIKNYIESKVPSTNNNNQSSFPITIASDTQRGNFDFSGLGEEEENRKKNRSIYLTLKLIDAKAQQGTTNFRKPDNIQDKLNETIKDYLSATIQDTYNYSFEVGSSGVIFAVDIFGSTGDPDLQEKDVKVAVDYSAQKNRRAQQRVGGLEPQISFTNQTAAPSTTTAPNASTTTPNTTLNACGEANQLYNEQLYVKIKKNDTASKEYYKSFQADLDKINKAFVNSLQDIPKLLQKASLFGESLQAPGNIKDQLLLSLIFKDFPDSIPTSPDENIFTYSSPFELISVVEEGAKRSPSTPNVPPSSLGPRGTNLSIMFKNGLNLYKFAKGLTKFIARNEGLTENDVFFMPISVFRPFRKVNPNAGVDQNSRHFFNRAIDFVVYINDNPAIGLSTDSVLNTGNFFKDDSNAYIIKEDILYLYTIKFLQQNKNPFADAGVGLLNSSQKRTTGYVHYEFMSDYREPKAFGIVNPKTKRSRRWVSQPKGKEKTLYKKVFNQVNKDSLIKSIIANDLKSRFGSDGIPDKILRLLR